MNVKICLNTKRIIVYLLLLISVFPAYYHIAGRMVSSVILVPLLFVMAVAGGCKIKSSDFKVLFLFFCWILIKSAIYCYHGETLRALSFSLFIISIAFVVSTYVTTIEKFLSLIDMMLVISGSSCNSSESFVSVAVSPRGTSNT